MTEDPKRLELLIELSARLKTVAPDSLHSALGWLLRELVASCQCAERGAILLCDPGGDVMHLGDFVSEGAPSVSMTLAEEAVRKGERIVWSGGDPTQSMRDSEIATALYIPLNWNGIPLGVLCLDRKDTGSSFSDSEIAFAEAVSNFVAVAIASCRQTDSMRRSQELLNNYERFVSHKARTLLAQEAGPVRAHGKFANVTVIFADLRGFTLIANKLRPGETIDMMEAYWDALVPIIDRRQGSIDKYVGDALLAVFDNEPVNDQIMSALQAAVEMQAAVAELNKGRTAKGKPVAWLGIGVNAGEVVEGFVGAGERFEFTVLGSVVNLASRYCDAAGPGEILISADVLGRVYRAIHAEATRIPTKHEGDMTAYRLRGLKEPS